MVLQRQERKFYTVTGIMLSVCWLWLFYNVQFHTHSVTICLFKRFTHLPCPACGTTQSAMTIFKGEFEHAFLLNPLGYMAVAFMICLPLWLLYDLLSQRLTLKSAYQKTEHLLKRNPILLTAVLTLITINWIWNLYKEILQ